MKIELTDREYWLNEVEERLNHIETIRQQENKRMESLPWYRKIFLSTFDYPSRYAFGIKYDLENVKKALLTSNTGVIYVDSDELKALRW